jgi:hypothetical protein
LEAGFDVTVIEKAGLVGKFGAVNVNGTYHEHAYHFLADWCVNFWEIAASIGLTKTTTSSGGTRSSSCVSDQQTGALTGNTISGAQARSSLLHFWDNVNSGVIPPEDMIVYALAARSGHRG